MEDVAEFSSMYQIPWEECIGLMFDFEINGRPIAITQKRYAQKGIMLSRSQAAHIHFDSRFPNRTKDVREQESGK